MESLTPLAFGKMLQDSGVSGDGVIQNFLSIKNTAVPRPAIPQCGLLFNAFDLNIGDALDGAKTAPEALNAVANVWRQIGVGS